MDIVERLLSRIKVNSEGCFEWQGPRHRQGYGLVFANGKKSFAHRDSFQAFRREIPSGMCVCHRCDNPCCINPAHLFLGTHADNMKDMARKKRSTAGEKSHSAKVSASDVLEMTRLYKSGVDQGKLAQRYGIARCTVSEIVRGTKWRGIIREVASEGRAAYRGSRHPNAKLNEGKVREVRKMHKSGVETKSIAKAMGVCEGTIHAVLTGTTWSHVV